MRHWCSTEGPGPGHPGTAGWRPGGGTAGPRPPVCSQRRSACSSETPITRQPPSSARPRVDVTRTRRHRWRLGFIHWGEPLRGPALPQQQLSRRWPGCAPKGGSRPARVGVGSPGPVDASPPCGSTGHPAWSGTPSMTAQDALSWGPGPPRGVRSCWPSSLSDRACSSELWSSPVRCPSRPCSHRNRPVPSRPSWTWSTGQRTASSRSRGPKTLPDGSARRGTGSSSTSCRVKATP